MKIKRRSFIKTSLAAGAGLALSNKFAKSALAQSGVSSSPSTLPWNREVSLQEAAKSVTIDGVLNPTNPLPARGSMPAVGAAMAINNLKMRTTLWGPPERITISLTKNNVWDRRIHEFKPPTLEDIREGAFAKVNENYDGVRPTSLRPIDLGWLWKEGGSHDPSREPIRYAFPSLKPVGQIILGMDTLAGADAPHLTQSCANGIVKLSAQKGDEKVNVQYVLGMTSNLYAIRVNLSGVSSPVTLRLYRHQDTSHLFYMTPDGKSYTNPAAEADKAYNGPIDPPSSGVDGKYFWIRQRMPAEKTFPKGFEYVLMGVIAEPAQAKLDSVEEKKGLGTAPPSPDVQWDLHGAPIPSIAEAPGAAATATILPAGDGKLEALVTIVTTMDGEDLMGLAQSRLDEATKRGFDGVAEENTKWWTDFYSKRENGRIFRGLAGSNCTDDVREIYESYTDSHGGGTKTDMRKFECSASYALPERDFQQWFSSPCYNEIFTTPRFVRNWADSEDMWKQLVWHWMPAAEKNAHDMCNMPGMLIVHGYLPPVKPDKYVHNAIALEFCLGTMAQLIRPAWDEWDYGGDVKYLREVCYPLMKQMALFYGAYAKQGDDGYYHVIPSMQEEDWGFYPKFSRNKDIISSLCMFRWALTRAADAAELLDVDVELRTNWRQVAERIVPYPTWERSEGKVFAEMPELEPYRLPGDHFGDAASYPAILADEINLDSPEELQQMMIRSVRTLPSGNTDQTLTVLGVPLQPPNPPGAGAPTNAVRRRVPEIDPEMLLNSRSGRIHLFPVVRWDPPAINTISKKNDIAFHKFQARGGFLISACKNSDGVYYVEIEARRDIPCKVMNPWPGNRVVVREVNRADNVPAQMDTTNGECLIFAARMGHRYLLSRA